MEVYIIMLIVSMCGLVVYVFKFNINTRKKRRRLAAGKMKNSRFFSALKSSRKKKDDEGVFAVKISFLEFLTLVVVFGSLGYFVSWYFYLNRAVSIAFSVIFQLLIPVYKREKKKRKKNKIVDEFINLNHLLLAELQTGISISLAYERVYTQIVSSEIMDFKNLEPEIRTWINKLHTGSDISDILIDFADRSGENSLVQFANMLSISSKRGGNILDIILSTNAVLNDERQMSHDIEVLITEKKLEQRVITIMPLFILIFLNYSAYDFISPLYESAIGRITMTVLLFIFTVAYFWSKKLTELKND